MSPLLDALQEAIDFIEGYEDVIDGDYNEPRPNAAMKLNARLRLEMRLHEGAPIQAVLDAVKAGEK